MNGEVTSNRVDIFRQLTVDELNQTTIDNPILKSLASDQYQRFVEVCEYVKEHPEPVIHSLSCYLEDGKAKFEINTENGVVNM